MTKDEVERAWADLPGDTLVSVASPDDVAMSVERMKVNLLLVPGGQARHLVVFHLATEDQPHPDEETSE